MTGDEALGQIMAVIREDLPEAETRLELGKILGTFGHFRWSSGYEDGREMGHEE